MERCIPLEALPLRLVAFGRCFRAEAGESFLICAQPLEACIT